MSGNAQKGSNFLFQLGRKSGLGIKQKSKKRHFRHKQKMWMERKELEVFLSG